MNKIVHIIDWNSEEIAVLDENDYKFCANAESVEWKIEENSNQVLDTQDADIILNQDYEFWAKELMDNAIATLNELLELKPELKKEFKSI